MTMPKISIVMPVKNRQHTIERAILSVINQQYNNIELIILDGGSTDQTIEVIKKYEQHITYWHSKLDGNPTIAVNEGIARATGDLVALLMSDDEYQPGLFQQLAIAYQANPQADMFTCGGQLVQMQQDGKTQVLMRFETERSLRLNFYNICFASSGICSRFVKKSLYEKIGLFVVADQHGKHIICNDKEFLLRAVLAQAKNVFVPIIGYRYFAHSDSTTFGKNRKNIMRLCEEHMLMAEEFIKNQQLTLSQKLQMIYWYNDQSARLFAYQCLQGDWRKACGNLFTALKKYSFIWPVSFVITSARIAVARMKYFLFHPGL